MNTPKRIVSVITTFLLAAAVALNAEEKKRVSPHETVSATIDGAQIKIVYGRPYTKDPKSGEMRHIWGGLVPFGKVWRLGADEATLLTTDRELDLGGTKIPAGTYSLFMMPEENGAKLIVNKQTGQWGTKYEAAEDFAKVDLKKGELGSPVDQFTIAIDKESSGGVMRFSWEKNEYSVAFSVKK